MIGTTIGKYRIVGQIGRGATGTVYKAVDETLNREVAIKVLNPDLADSDIMKRFRAEATTLAKLNHPEIATIYELVRSDTDLLMVMEYVRGETVDKLAERLGPLPPDRAAYLIDRVLSGLEHAHRAGIVHRDMKPANVMVTKAGGIKIMDFGIARVRGSEHMTVDGRMMGTPAYMAPEQVLGEPVDGRADLYSVGVMFYRLLTGTLPFQAETALAMLQRQINDPPAPMAQHRPGLPDWCEAIVQRALAKSPADRFQTPEEFREAIGKATGMTASAELAKMFAIEESEVITAPPQAMVLETLVEPVRQRAAAPADTIVLRKQDLMRVGSIAAILAIGVVMLAYAALRRPTAVPVMTVAAAPQQAAARQPQAAAAREEREPEPEEEPEPTSSEPEPDPEPPRRRRSAEPPLTFETKTIVSSKGSNKERSAYLKLADGQITVTADDETRALLYSVPYERVLAINYSRSRHPMWNSPQGPAPVVRTGGTLSRFGISFDRHWISLRTRTSHQFVNLRFDEVVAPKVLVALEERTGRKHVVIEEEKDDGKDKGEK